MKKHFIQGHKKCNISSTEALIVIKFETYARMFVFDDQPNFHKDPCKDALARNENAPKFSNLASRCYNK